MFLYSYRQQGLGGTIRVTVTLEKQSHIVNKQLYVLKARQCGCLAGILRLRQARLYTKSQAQKWQRYGITSIIRSSAAQ